MRLAGLLREGGRDLLGRRTAFAKEGVKGAAWCIYLSIYLFIYCRIERERERERERRRR